MRTIALFSDIHGNIDALLAVLDDIEAAAPDDTFCLGDLVGYGPDPAAVVDAVRSRGVPTVRGNYDDGIGSDRGGCGCYYADDAARAGGEASYAFTTRSLGPADKAWLASLPPEIRLLSGDVKIVLAHGSPRRINEYLTLERTDEQLARLAAAAEADLVCVGHVHVPYHRAVRSGEALVHYVNPGSVGKPKDGDPRACWVELFLGEENVVRRAAPGDASSGPVGRAGTWAAVKVHRVAYDVEKVAASMAAAGLPPELGEALRRG